MVQTSRAFTDEGRVEEFELLRNTVFRDREVFGFEVGDGFAFLVFNDDVDVDEIGFDSDDVIGVLRIWWILCLGGEREEQGS